MGEGGGGKCSIHVTHTRKNGNITLARAGKKRMLDRKRIFARVRGRFE
jgi:hypothetical protein